MEEFDTVVVGGGVAGLTAGMFTARAGFDTRVVNFGSSILNRNAHLENFPGFPAGLSPRLFLEMLQQQFQNHGGELVQGRVDQVSNADTNFLVDYKNKRLKTTTVIAASWSDVSYLSELGVSLREEGSKTFIQTDRHGRSSCEGMYAAGRIAGTYHQAIVAAGDGAKTALTLLEDHDSDFYHDWVTPDGYFTDRDREVPEGCSEIRREEWSRRSRKAKNVLSDFLERHEETNPKPHPSQEDQDS